MATVPAGPLASRMTGLAGRRSKATGEAPEIGIGMLGYAFMGKAHTNAYKTIPYMMYPPPAIPKLISRPCARKISC